MKIAIPTDDRLTMAGHFGRAAEFAIFEINGAEISEPEFRKNEHTHGGEHDHDHGMGEGHGDSRDFHGPLNGVNYILCGGMGQKARYALDEMGIRSLFCSPGEITELAKAFAEGVLETGEPSCGCGH